jgi:tetratricopeptide (TPR) repeat protein
MVRAALRSWLTSTLLLLLMAATVQAQAAKSGAGERAAVDDKEARELFRLGKQAFDEGRFERSLKYFNDAYDLSHRAALLSNVATALDRLRRDQEAVDAYQKYLALVPDAPNREQVEERVRIIQSALDKAQAAARPQPAPQPSAAAPTPAETARAATQDGAAPASATATTADAATTSSGGVTSRWWFWAGVGTLAAAAIVVGVAAGSSGGGTATESPAVVGSATRVRDL